MSASSAIANVVPAVEEKAVEEKERGEKERPQMG